MIMNFDELLQAIRDDNTTSIVFRYNQITDTIAQHLSEALKANQTLTSIDLRSNQITDIGARHLSEALKVNQTLTSIDLWSNQITDIGARHLSKALKVNQTLTSIDLKGNRISNKLLGMIDFKAAVNKIKKDPTSYKITDLILFAKNGDLETLTYLHQNGADINAQNNNGRTPIYSAAYNGHLEILTYLHQNGANINAKDNDGWTPIHPAAYNGHLEILTYLHQNGADINAKNNDDRTPIHLAAENGNLEILIYLHQNGADINAKDNDGWTPIHSAARNGHLEILTYLHQNGADINTQDNKGWTPIHAAAKNHHLETLIYLLKNGVDGADSSIKVNQTLTPPVDLGFSKITDTIAQHLSEALKVNQTLTSIYLWGNEITDTGAQHLSEALKVNQTLTSIYLGHNQITDIGAQHLSEALKVNQTLTSIDLGSNRISDELLGMIDFQAAVNKIKKDPTSYKITDLILFVKNGDLETLTYLHQNGADINAKDNDGLTPIHSAAYNGHLEILTYLHQNGADINAKNNDDRTPIHLAAENGNLEILTYLHQNGADINAEDELGYAPIHVAVRKGHLNILKYLVENNVSIDIEDNKGRTLIHLAAISGNVEVFTYLCENGADINAQNNNGSTPIHAAADYGHLEILTYLHQNGADINAQNNNGRTPIHLAAKNGHLETLTYLIKNGADTSINENRTLINFISYMDLGKDYTRHIINLLYDSGAEINLAKDGKAIQFLKNKNGKIRPRKNLSLNIKDNEIPSIKDQGKPSPESEEKVYGVKECKITKNIHEFLSDKIVSLTKLARDPQGYGLQKYAELKWVENHEDSKMILKLTNNSVNDKIFEIFQNHNLVCSKGKKYFILTHNDKSKSISVNFFDNQSDLGITGIVSNKGNWQDIKPDFQNLCSKIESEILKYTIQLRSEADQKKSQQQLAKKQKDQIAKMASEQKKKNQQEKSQLEKQLKSNKQEIDKLEKELKDKKDKMAVKGKKSDKSGNLKEIEDKLSKAKKSRHDMEVRLDTISKLLVTPNHKLKAVVDRSDIPEHLPKIESGNLSSQIPSNSPIISQSKEDIALLQDLLLGQLNFKEKITNSDVIVKEGLFAFDCDLFGPYLNKSISDSDDLKLSNMSDDNFNDLVKSKIIKYQNLFESPDDALITSFKAERPNDDLDSQTIARHYFHKLLEEVIIDIQGRSGLDVGLEKEKEIRSRIYDYLNYLLDDQDNIRKAYRKSEIEGYILGSSEGIGHAKGNSSIILAKLCFILDQFIASADEVKLLQSVKYTDIGNFLGNLWFSRDIDDTSQTNNYITITHQKDDLSLFIDLIKDANHHRSLILKQASQETQSYLDAISLAMDLDMPAAHFTAEQITHYKETLNSYQSIKDQQSYIDQPQAKEIIKTMIDFINHIDLVKEIETSSAARSSTSVFLEAIESMQIKGSQGFKRQLQGLYERAFDAHYSQMQLQEVVNSKHGEVAIV